MKRALCLAFVALGLICPALAQQAPQIRVEKAEKPVALRRAEISLSVVGPLASATETLTFSNPNGRALEGELLLPLPEGATLSGYAIDVAGELVDAVPVEKERARVIYETELRKGVDPGLAEKAEGNVFRLRVYPIPAKGTRTIRVRFDLESQTRGAGRTVTLPLRWGIAPDEVRLSVEGAGTAKIGDTALDGPTTTLDGQRLDADLVIRAPAPTEPCVYAESFTRASRDAAETFFLVESHEVAPVSSLNPLPPGNGGTRLSPPLLGAGGLGVIWDASLSRKDANVKQEKELLRLLLARLDGVSVTVRILRDTLEPAKNFRIENGDSTALLAYLDSIPLDGGTDLSALQNLPVLESGYCLLFSDGTSTLGSPPSPVPHGGESGALRGTPLWAVTSGATSSYPALRQLSELSGGALVDLTRTPVSAALWEIGQPVFGLQKITTLSGQVEGVTFRREGSLISGRLLSETATLALEYGYTGQAPTVRHEVTLTQNPPNPRPAGAKAERFGGKLARWWAAQQAETLSIDPDGNREALVTLGQDFGIVTEGTSLLVLETLEQHIEHDVRPARTRPALYDAYLAHEKKQARQEKQKDDAQLQKVLAQWKETLAWWDKKFTYPPGFQYKPKPAKKDGDGPSTGGGQVRSRVGGLPRRAASPPHPVDLSYAPRELAVRAEAKSIGGQDEPNAAASVSIKPWSPDVPYVKAMQAAGPERAYEVYLAQRKTWGATPAFYVDCAEALLQLGRKQEARRVLLSLAEIGAGDPALLRILARRLLQIGELGRAVALFERVLQLRPEEAQSLRDLALALEAHGDNEGALRHLDALVRGRWQRADSDFDGIEVIALIEANGILSKVGTQKLKNPLDPRFVKPLTADLRIVMAWDTDLTDMDLHVIEPSDEECFYSHNRTVIGGHLSHDCTRGYGPEEYFVRKAMPGKYTVRAKFYGSQSQKALGGTTVQATVITNFGRPTEKRSYLTLRLTEQKESIEIGAVNVR